ncbi:hypothetical protein JRQ81_010065 [Phrynocephalus forsythii]|uniref:Uncharacterized protein n=1 Tax=Phrynocephalus forsythii TaxID=171643 RepID=A0A9Q1AQZ7_9SAUR|nr:hypothetical protein JRQ81_010065 [Phrynocephalus forsythii]
MWMLCLDTASYKLTSARPWENGIPSLLGTPREERVAHLEAKVSDLIEKARHAVERNNPHYYKAFAPVLAPDFWKMPRQWQSLNTSVAFVPTSGACLELPESDVCLSAILGTLEDSVGSCLVTEKCRTLETQTHCSDYSLSHQLLYFLFAEMQGCLDPIFLNTGYYKNVFCQLMMQHNLQAERQSHLTSLGDLFTENIVFCGIAGFSEFYKPAWLDFILSWQKPGKGCFWMYESLTPAPKQPVQNPRRVKRTEKILQDGCSSHNTAVAVAAIGGYLYYSS